MINCFYMNCQGSLAPHCHNMYDQALWPVICDLCDCPAEAEPLMEHFKIYKKSTHRHIFLLTQAILQKKKKKKPCSFWFNEGRHETLLKTSQEAAPRLHKHKDTHSFMHTHTHTHLKSFPLCPHVHGVTHNEVYFASWKNNSYITWDLQIHKVCTHNPHHTVYERGVL